MKQKILKRAAGILLTAVLVCGSLAGCSQKSGEEAQSPAPGGTDIEESGGEDHGKDGAGYGLEQQSTGRWNGKGICPDEEWRSSRILPTDIFCFCGQRKGGFGDDI